MKWNRGSRHISLEFTQLDIKAKGRAPPLATDVETLALKGTASARLVRGWCEAGEQVLVTLTDLKQKNWSKGFDRLTG